MSEVYVINKSTLQDIGNAIREKSGKSDPILVSNLSQEILNIPTGSVGELLQAGKYKMIDYQYESSYPGSFAWGSQELKGIYYESEGASGADFTSITNDGQWEIVFRNNGTYVADILPYWNPYDYTTYIVLDEAQFISEAFSTWFNTCFEKVENGGGGGEIIAEELKNYTIKAGRYVDNDSATGDYVNLPYPSYSASADILGQIIVDGSNLGNFTKIYISGFGQGMDENNNLEDAPYPSVSFYNDSAYVYSFEGTEMYSIGVEIFISEDTNVTATFCIAFRGLFE